MSLRMSLTSARQCSSRQAFATSKAPVLAESASKAPLVSVDLVSVDLVSVDLVSVDLVSVDLVSVDLVSVDLVSAEICRS